MIVVCLGIGDGPWNQMAEFNNYKPNSRKFDNFQFVCFKHAIKFESHNMINNEMFNKAFMKVPYQYKAAKKLLGYVPHVD